MTLCLTTPALQLALLALTFFLGGLAGAALAVHLAPETGD